MICRFINADSYASTGQGFLGYNMFAYCDNDPITGYDPTGHANWGKITDTLVNGIAASSAMRKGLIKTAAELAAEKSPLKAIGSGLATAIATFGSVNNGVNAIYYNNIATEKSNIWSNDESSSYIYGYETRWDRLNFTRQQTSEERYNVTAWLYFSEYSVHMYGWYATGWAYGQEIPVFSNSADRFRRADVHPGKLDERLIGVIGTMLWGVIGA